MKASRKVLLAIAASAALVATVPALAYGGYGHRHYYYRAAPVYYAPPPFVYAPRPVYYPPQVVYAPAPAYYYYRPRVVYVQPTWYGGYRR